MLPIVGGTQWVISKYLPAISVSINRIANHKPPSRHGRIMWRNNQHQLFLDCIVVTQLTSATLLGVCDAFDQPLSFASLHCIFSLS
jgi:hypothetical protein